MGAADVPPSARDPRRHYPPDHMQNRHVLPLPRYAGNVLGEYIIICKPRSPTVSYSKVRLVADSS